MNAVGYIRISTEEQAREGVSLDNQRRRIEAFPLLRICPMELGYGKENCEKRTARFCHQVASYPKQYINSHE